MSRNICILIGNLGAAPELHTFNGGKVARLSLATNENYKSKKTGEWESETQWHTVALWGAAAERAEANLKKGDKVLIQGTLKYDKYDKDGETRVQAKVHTRSYELLSERVKSAEEKNKQDKQNEGIPF